MRTIFLSNRGRRLRRILAASFAIAMVAGSILASRDVDAGGRDSDGSRMLARQITVGSWHADELSPPKDKVDWHYFKLDKPKSTSVRLKLIKSSKPATLTLTSATGDRLARTKTKGGNGKVAKRLDPGLYYLSVESKAAISYQVRVD